MASLTFGWRSQPRIGAGGTPSVGFGVVHTSLNIVVESHPSKAARFGMHPMGPASVCVTIVALAGGVHSAGAAPSLASR